MLQQTIDRELKGARRVLLLGAGGGFDFVCGLPLLLALERRGCETLLASLSFTPMESVRNAQRHRDNLWEVGADADGPNYFPERWVAHWFRERRQREIAVWGFVASGQEPYRESLAWLADHLEIDTIFVVDGGVDSLMRGDEHSLGTPLWDAMTVGAANSLSIERKILATVAFGAERWDRISHAQVFARIAELTSVGALLGVETLLKYEPESESLIEAAEYIFDGQRGSRGSIVTSSLIAAMRGEFGEQPVNAATQDTPLWVSPLMPLFWYFDLEEVARRKRFLPALEGTQTLGEAADRLQSWMQKQPDSVWEPIPI